MSDSMPMPQEKMRDETQARSLKTVLPSSARLGMSSARSNAKVSGWFILLGGSSGRKPEELPGSNWIAVPSD